MTLPPLSQHTVLTVFLASPGDLTEERRIARDEVQKLNKIFNECIGWHINLLGWEDTLPGQSRPQELINQDLDRCDLFVGLLWKRWGSATGQFSSGFEEEFTRAMLRRTNSGYPEVWLFFKQVDAATGDDPGVQLQRVMQFRREQEATRQVFYKTFSDTSDWKDQFTSYLMRHTLSLHRDRSSSVASNASTNSIAADATHDTPPLLSTESSLQLTALFQSATSFVDPNNSSDSRLTPLEISRLYLYSESLFASHVSATPLNIHSCNAVYVARDTVTLVPNELRSLMYTLIADRYESVPGWYWYRDFATDAIAMSLLTMALFDQDSGNRYNALRHLRHLRLTPNEIVSLEPTAFARLFHDSSPNIREETALLFTSNGSPQDIPILYSITPPLSDTDPATYYGLQAVLVSRISLQAGLAMLIDHPEARSDWFTEDSALTDDIPLDTLYRLLSDKRSTLKQQAMLSLIERGAFQHSMFISPLSQMSDSAIMTIVDKLMDNTSLPLEAIEELETLLTNRSGVSAEFRETFDRKRMSRWSNDELQASMHPFAIRAPVAYELLAVRQRALHDVLTDLNSGFEGLIAEVSREWERTRNDANGQTVQPLNGSLLNFLRDSYITSAFRALSQLDPPDTVLPLIKNLLPGRWDDYNRAGLEALAAISNPNVWQTLISVGMALEAPLSSYAFQLAADVTSNAANCMHTLLTSGNRMAICVALRNMWKIEVDGGIDLVKTLLSSDESEIRFLATSFLIHHLNDHDIEEIMSNYISQQTYYYNVAGAFDRSLYYPSTIRDAYREALRAAVFGGKPRSFWLE